MNGEAGVCSTWAGDPQANVPSLRGDELALMSAITAGIRMRCKDERMWRQLRLVGGGEQVSITTTF